jgi:hypothetical protein
MEAAKRQNAALRPSQAKGDFTTQRSTRSDRRPSNQEVIPAKAGISASIKQRIPLSQ